MFANVLKKFFTGERRNENKALTTTHKGGRDMKDLKDICHRARATLAQDFAAASLLVLTFYAVLHMPGFI